MIKKGQLAKHGTVGGFERNAKRCQRAFVKLMPQMVGGGDGGGGNICGAAGHPFGNRDGRMHINADILAQLRRVVPVLQ